MIRLGKRGKRAGLRTDITKFEGLGSAHRGRKQRSGRDGSAGCRGPLHENAAIKPNIAWSRGHDRLLPGDDGAHPGARSGVSRLFLICYGLCSIIEHKFALDYSV